MYNIITQSVQPPHFLTSLIRAILDLREGGFDEYTFEILVVFESHLHKEIIFALIQKLQRLPLSIFSIHFDLGVMGAKPLMIYSHFCFLPPARIR